MNLFRKPEKKETIGNCDWCGMIDHHLIDGECPSCQALSINYGDALGDSVPLGIESAMPSLSEQSNYWMAKR